MMKEISFNPTKESYYAYVPWRPDEQETLYPWLANASGSGYTWSEDGMGIYLYDEEIFIQFALIFL